MPPVVVFGLLPLGFLCKPYFLNVLIRKFFTILSMPVATGAATGHAAYLLLWVNHNCESKRKLREGGGRRSTKGHFQIKLLDDRFSVSPVGSTSSLCSLINPSNWYRRHIHQHNIIALMRHIYSSVQLLSKGARNRADHPPNSSKIPEASKPTVSGGPQSRILATSLLLRTYIHKRKRPTESRCRQSRKGRQCGWRTGGLLKSANNASKTTLKR
jgi:hypothetical protein